MKIDTVHNKSSQSMDELADNSIDCALTSPPYWGLRNYGDDVKEIWGGDEDCEHQWGSKLSAPKGEHHHGQGSSTLRGGNVSPGENWNKETSGKKLSSQFCRLCNAWHGQLGLEPTFQLYLDHMMVVCAEVRRVLKKTGSFWLNMGDTYGGSWQNFGSREGGQRPKTTLSFERKDNPQFYPPTARATSKCLLGIPWRLVLRLIDEQGWILRNAIIWNKPNAMPSSVKDRCSNGYEFLFHLVKEKKYYYDLDAIRESHSLSAKKRYEREKAKNLHSQNPDNKWLKSNVKDPMKGLHGKSYADMPYYENLGKNPGDVWTIPTQPRPEAHFAMMRAVPLPAKGSRRMPGARAKAGVARAVGPADGYIGILITPLLIFLTSASFFES